MSENKNSKVTMSITIILSILIGLMLGRLVYKDNLLVKKTYDSNDKLTTLLNLINQNYVDSVSVDSIIEKVIPKILAELDPHSTYIQAVDYAEVQAPLDGSFEGIGVQFNVQNDTILIIDVISGGPSEKEGLIPGDRIITINDSLFVGKKITSDVVIKNLKGKKGTEVKLGIKRAGSKELLSYTITRDKIPLYSVDANYMYDSEIGYIKIDRFAQTTYTEFMKAIDELKSQGMKKLILDLRGNGGGYLIEATDIADEFLPKGDMIVFTQGKSRPREEYFATNKDECIDLDLVVLTDTWSASASEILAGALQDNDRATIIGRRTFGKGLVQEPIGFNDGSSVRLTVAKYFTPTGRCIQKPFGENNEDYENEVYKRIMNGELEKEDTTFYADSLKFVTKKGKVVYGGGGIMPDIFVPMDTTGYSKFLDKLANKNLIYKFSIDYADCNRSVLKKFTTSEILVNYLIGQSVFEKFITFAGKEGVKPENDELKISEKILKVQLYSYIVRNILGEDEFYKVYEQIDNTFLKAVEVLKTSQK